MPEHLKKTHFTPLGTMTFVDFVNSFDKFLSIPSIKDCFHPFHAITAKIN